MTSGLGFGQVDLFQSNPEVKGSCFPIHLLNFSTHQLFIYHPILLFAPSLPPLPTFIPPFFSILQFPLIRFVLNSFSLHNHPLSFSLLYSSLPHYILCHLLCPPYSLPSIPPSIQPSLHASIPSSINASPPLCPFMCLSLVKKQCRSQIVQPLTCCCFVLFSLIYNHKHLHLTHTVQDS